jgi:dephospho-CoA kinase
MQRWGLTGGIASGKSTVAAMLREEGLPVIEADKISHGLIERTGAAYAEVVQLFGEAILNVDGSINRSRVAAIVFNNPEQLRQLNGILHPRVALQLARQMDELEKSGECPAAFVEAALIFEAGLHKMLDGVAVAWCQPEQQLARLTERGMSEAEARKRMAAQMAIEEKLALATVKIDCAGSLEATRRQVKELAQKLKKIGKEVTK